MASAPSIVRLQTAGNVLAAIVLWWLTAPLLVVGGRHPFDTTASRLGGVGAVVLVALLWWAARRAIRQRRNAQLFERMQGGADPAASEALVKRFQSAMSLLRAGIEVERGGRRGALARLRRLWRPRRQVYELPWYVFIGAAGAGKTTALLHSGLRFPLAEGLGTAPVAGIGGTRQCDWWFTDRAVFIDTAGRYTTQDSHGATDAQEWQTFLRLLRQYRPVQPINGVIVTVSVPDLIHGGAELERQAAAVESRLLELRRELGLAFPLYLLVTKADLLAGFVEFFDDFDADRREQLWGVTFGYPPGAADVPLPVELASQLAQIPARVAGLRARRMQEEPLAQRRALIFQFPAQIEAMLPALEAFARRAFRGTAAVPRQTVRGICFSSGTQEGNPIDRVLGQLSRSYGMSVRTLPRPDAGGKAYFLNALLKRLVIGEAPIAGTNLQRRQRRRWIAIGAGSVLTVVLVLACAGWWVSYRSNLDYVDAVGQRVQAVMGQIGPGKPASMDRLLPVYAMLSDLASTGQVDPARPPFGFGFGLFQGPRLAQSAQQTYHRVLDQTLAPVLAMRLTQALRQESDPAARYEALRISEMLVTPGRLQRSEVRRWAAQAFAAPAVPRAASAAGAQTPGPGEQQELLRHLDALLERNAVMGAVRLDEGSLRAARSALAGVPLQQRVYDRVLARAREQAAGDRSLAELVSPGAVLAFVPQDAGAGVPSVASVYTRRAWRDLIDPILVPTVGELAAEAEWVLGDRSAGSQRIATDRSAQDEVAKQVAQRHAQATIAQWEALLSTVSFQLPAGTDGLVQWGSTMAAPASPLRELLRRVGMEFPAPAATGSPATQVFDAALNERFGVLADYARGPGAAAVDRLVAPAPALLRDPSNARTADLLRDLHAEAAKAPLPFKTLWAGFADALGAQQQRVVERQLAGGLAELGRDCRRITADRFPFAPDAKRDMSFADFARLFGPKGMLDSFFRARLAADVDVRRRPWRLAAAPDGPVQDKARASLRSFEMADDIRRLFFPEGTELPQLRIRLTPVDMDADLLLFSADVDGQLLRYENGPRRPKPVVWPGPAGTQRVLLRILPPGPSGVGAESHEGPWALLRVLGKHGWQRGKGAAPVARLDVDGRSLNLEVAADAPVDAGVIATLSEFRCPEGW
jgi:type VI secretion system protein ImpL